MYLYRAASSEMARLRELHEQCAHQQEALAAQLQGKHERMARRHQLRDCFEKSANAKTNKCDKSFHALCFATLYIKDWEILSEITADCVCTYKMLQIADFLLFRIL